jgi:hypothetical protein
VPSVGDEASGERKQHHEEQGQQIESQEDRIAPRNGVRQCHMEQPGGADRQEADQVGEVGGPRAQELLQGRAWRMNGDVHDQ